MCSSIVGVVTQRTLLDLYTRKEKELLLQRRDILFLQLTHEDLWRPARVTAVLLSVLDIGNTFIKLRPADLQTLTESRSVPARLHLTHHHRNLVDRLIKYQQLPVTIVHQAARGVNNLLDQGVVIRLVLGRLINNLQKKQSYHIHQHDTNSNATDDISASIIPIVNHLYFKIL